MSKDHQINKSIKFQLQEDKAHVSHGEINFQKQFFKSFVFNHKGFETSELDHDENDEVIYCFSIRSKILSVLFRKTDDDIESYRIALEGQGYKLNVEVRTKSLIRKQYNPYYQMYKYDKLGVAKRYKDLFIKQNKRLDDDEDDDENEINYLMIDNHILKGFLDNVNSSSTEDFKLEVNEKNFSITAFTKGIYIKEKEILKQPMAINIIFSTEELLDLKLWSSNTQDKQIIYRLKDFKTFLNLGNGSDFIEIWFIKPGDPILFEINKNDVTIQFVQVTDGENNHINLEKNTKVIPKEQIIKKSKKQAIKNPTKTNNDVIYDHTEELTNEFGAEPMFVPEDEDYQEPQPPRNLPPPPIPNLQNDISIEDDIQQDQDMSHESSPNRNDEISWGGDHDLNKENKISQLIQNSKKDESRLINEAKIKYLNSLKSNNKKRKLKKNQDSIEEEELGPTQNIHNIKGIFD
ncbi:DNA damage checkpoint protein 1 [Wickerhamomyces ciferrii]|uniref:DNA damage checkpoint protein 1 n=1 Tax=Wickerhamomyces ciferrii (strain ATCC 14091 / BCRC 22168 / CBS 111 / JCM 3599 / NBRC 0793 / NRRL Y-1031 F-60-10) TaxID=1206466 RepID=K0KG77_WICCF|nr:DNA damage checkpoint protein 1 [Wickerhamomyces ciferrii]CCH41961.1 DNA damage checkpoint protein 1 [Wickerhamomyces ciferrii]